MIWAPAALGLSDLVRLGIGCKEHAIVGVDEKRAISVCEWRELLVDVVNCRSESGVGCCACKLRSEVSWIDMFKIGIC